MRAPWLPTVACTAACASTPGPPVPDPLLVVEPGTGHIATTTDAPVQFAIDFARDGVRMPQSLKIDGIERLAMGSCAVESGVGIAIAPAVNVTAPTLGGPVATGGLEVRRAGPVVAEVRVTWTTQYTCPGAQTATGTSTFVAFPNGRIVRHDLATPSTTTLTENSSCGCGGSGRFYFTTYWAFAPGQNVNPDGSPYVDGTQQSCAVFPSHTIGVAWPPGNSRLVENGTSARVYEWVEDALTLDPTPQEVTSALAIASETSPARCANVVAALDDPGVFVGSKPVDSDELGIHVVDGAYADPVEITANRGTLPSFALSINVGHFASLERSPELPDEDWYFFQPDGDRTLFWFPKGLKPGESITIDPR